MTSHKKFRRILAVALTAAFSIAIILLAAAGVAGFDRNLRAEQLTAVQKSVQSAMIHCYSLEGSYPPNLAYLAKNYGLVLDTKHYIYDYSVFATNIPPEVHVFRKN
ncbi:MAG: hypothetical protein P4L75_01320 [Clostridia bacterium]|nr:hypothetical protein [Clostridia bacterium]